MAILSLQTYGEIFGMMIVHPNTAIILNRARGAQQGSFFNQTSVHQKIWTGVDTDIAADHSKLVELLLQREIGQYH